MFHRSHTHISTMQVRSSTACYNRDLLLSKRITKYSPSTCRPIEFPLKVIYLAQFQSSCEPTLMPENSCILLYSARGSAELHQIHYGLTNLQNSANIRKQETTFEVHGDVPSRRCRHSYSGSARTWERLWLVGGQRQERGTLLVASCRQESVSRVSWTLEAHF